MFPPDAAAQAPQPMHFTAEKAGLLSAVNVSAPVGHACAQAFNSLKVSKGGAIIATLNLCFLSRGSLFSAPAGQAAPQSMQSYLQNPLL